MELASSFEAIQYVDGQLVLLDQTRLPLMEEYVTLVSLEEVAVAIERMIVRGAPAIGVTAAYGMAMAKRTGIDLTAAHDRLARTRPTAVNLFFALDRMKAQAERDSSVQALESEAKKIDADERAASMTMARLGAELIPEGATVLTHCNTGALAAPGIGTALGAIRYAHAQGKKIKVFADETRPRLQGAKLTAWELQKDGLDVTLISDNMVAHFLGQNALDCAFVGADRIAANGDTANKIGTRSVACLFHHHQKPFYVVAPFSTVDMSLSSGELIPIEERHEEEVTTIGRTRIAPVGIKVRNPAFDVTPHPWITAIVTDRGVARGDLKAALKEQSV